MSHCDMNLYPCSIAHYSEDEQDCDEGVREEEIPKDGRMSNSSLRSHLPTTLPPSQPTPRPSEKVAGMKTSGNSNSTK